MPDKGVGDQPLFMNSANILDGATSCPLIALTSGLSEFSIYLAYKEGL
jgi:hypothetical protein